jgi:hypothetical protein
MVLESDANSVSKLALKSKADIGCCQSFCKKNNNATKILSHPYR